MKRKLQYHHRLICFSHKLTARVDVYSGLVRIYSEMVVMALLWHNVVLLRAYHAVLSLVDKHVITNVQRAVTPTIICINWLQRTPKSYTRATGGSLISHNIREKALKKYINLFPSTEAKNLHGNILVCAAF